MSTVLRFDSVRRTHRDGTTTVHAVAGVDLTVDEGEMVAITGRSGAGKSTLLNLAGGLDQPSAGRVTVDDQDLAHLAPRALAALRRRRIGFVFQQGNLVETLTAAENVALPLELDGVRSKAARRAALEALAEVLDPAAADRFPDQLSGGERQRVAIARALVGERRLVLADEPTGALDEVTGERILALLRARCDAGAAVVLVTHDPAQAAWADRIVRLRDGRIESVVPSEDVEVHP